MFYKILQKIFICTNLFFFSCANLSNIDNLVTLNSKEAYIPNIDLYIFRGGTSGFTAPDLNKDGIEDENVIDYVVSLFLQNMNSINNLQNQVDMVFYLSKIRVFLISTNRNEGLYFSSNTNYPILNNTYRDTHIIIDPATGLRASPQCLGDDLPQLDESEYQFCALNNNKQPILATYSDNLVYVDSKGMLCSNTPKPSECKSKCFIGDLASKYKFTLTDITGRSKKGTVGVDENNIRIFFSNKISICGNDTRGISGLSTIGTKNTISNNEQRYYFYSIAIARDYTLSFSEREYFTNKSINVKEKLISTISHELGHYFGLTHTFENTSCDYTPGRTAGATKNRIMDYNINGEVFSPCEKDIYTSLSSTLLKNKILYALDNNGSSIIKKQPEIYPYYNFVQLKNYENSNQTIQIYDGSWNGDVHINNFDNKFLLKKIYNMPLSIE